MAAAVASCSANLSGFRKAHTYSFGRSQDVFYKTDGTLAVGITGSPGKEGEKTDGYAITYMKLTPGLSEAFLLGMNKGKVICP